MSENDILLAVVCSTLVVLLLIAVLIIVFFLAGRQRMRQNIAMTQTRLHFERELRQVETEVSEQVMNRFARELHDNIGQLLTAMHFQLENQKIDHPPLAERLKPLEIYLGEITQQLRLLSHTLNNDYIGHIGLTGALQKEIDRLIALKRFQVHRGPIQGPSNLDKDQELMVFRIFQEISQNVLRHSEARNLYIHLGNADGNFELHVRDDGRGFDPAQTQRNSGLRNIFRRAELAGLSCTIESTPGKGCTVILKKVSSLYTE